MANLQFIIFSHLIGLFKSFVGTELVVKKKSGMIIGRMIQDMTILDNTLPIEVHLPLLQDSKCGEL
jgi:hypothetical protein